MSLDVSCGSENVSFGVVSTKKTVLIHPGTSQNLLLNEVKEVIKKVSVDKLPFSV